jgi:hypothetical protein
VHVAPIVEMLNASPLVTRHTSLARDSDQPPQTFKDSLLAASRTSSDTGSVHLDGPRTGRRQAPAADDRKLPHATLHSGVAVLPAPPQQTVQQQVPPGQQLPVIDPAPVVPLQLPPGGTGESPQAVTVAIGETRDSAVPTLPSIASNTVQPVIAKPDNIASVDTREQGDTAPVASVLPASGYGSQAATNLSPAVTGANPDFVTAAPYPPSSIAPSPVADSTPGLVPDAVQTVAPDPGAIQNAVQIAAFVHPPHAAATPGLAPGTPAQTVSDTVAKASPQATPHVNLPDVSTAAPNSTLSSAAAVPVDATPVTIAHGGANASTKEDVAQKANAVSANQANPPAPPPSPGGWATLPNVPGTTAGQLAALIQPAHGFNMSSVVQEKPSDGGVVDRKGGAGNSINEVTGVKPHGQVDAASAPSQAVSQDSSPSGDQSQGSASQQGQNAATAQLNATNHTIAAVDHTQNLGTAVLSPSAPVLAGVSDHAAKPPQTAAPAPIVVPQAVPVINTAKLIQSMGQSEMHVGMRSTDFGNISISTSATRGLISAQISLDHGELARTLAAHLPEMQAKFGGNQAMNVRIDMNGHQPTGQSAGTSAGMSNGSADQSRGDRQQRGSGTTRQSGEAFAGQLNSMTTAVLPAAESRLDARLDIRV